MIILDLPDFHGLCASLSVTFDMYFNGRNKDILFVYLFIYCRSSSYQNLKVSIITHIGCYLI